MSPIRPSRDADVPAITAIYGHHVLHGTGTVETIYMHRDAGAIHSCGWKFGRWLDIVIMEKGLGAGATTPPDAAA